MPSCAYIRLHLWFYYKRAKSRLETHMQDKEDEKFRRMITEYKKLGYDRRDNGPSNSEVPEDYNLVYAGDNRTIQRWKVNGGFTSKSKRDYEMELEVARCIDEEWNLQQSRSIIQHPSKIFIKPRLEILLHITLNEARRNARSDNKWLSKLKLKPKHNQNQYQAYNQDEDSCHRLNPESPTGIDLINLTSDRRIWMPFQSNGTKLSLDGKVDHVVFSGDPDELDTTFIILRAPHRGRARVWTLLRAMAMIHHARKATGRDSQIYGLATDSYEFAFAHIDNKSRYSTWFLHWQKQPVEIVSQFMKIIEYAGTRAKAAVRAKGIANLKACAKHVITNTVGYTTTNYETVSQRTGCRIYPEYEWNYSTLERNNLDCFERL